MERSHAAAILGTRRVASSSPPRGGALPTRERAPIHRYRPRRRGLEDHVSRVLNDSARVAPETRTRVLEVIDGLGFQVNHAARSLRTSRTGLVGILVPVISIFGLIVESLDADLAEDGVSILLTSSRRHHPDRDVDAIETLVGRGVDALVLAPSNDRSASLARLAARIRQPLVLLDREVRGVEADALLVDQGPGMHGASSHLAGLGRRRIGLLTRDRKTRPGREIIGPLPRGLRAPRAARRARAGGRVRRPRPRAGRNGVDRLLAAGADAIIATGTMVLTASILERLGDLGVRVPLPTSRWWSAASTASPPTRTPRCRHRLPRRRDRAATARLLLRRLDQPEAAPRSSSVPTIFIDTTDGA